MRRRINIAILVAIVSIMVAAPAPLYAQGKQLRYNLRMDLALTALMSAGYLGTAALENHLAPQECRWCSVNAFDDWGHRNLAWSNTGAANTASHVTGFALATVAAFGLDALASHHDGRLKEFPIDALVIAEAASAAAMFTQIIKIAAGRQRPSAHYRVAGDGVSSPDDNTSFFSGHTTIAFSLAVASGTVASMKGYRLAPVIWSVGLATAATTGYLRIAADKHYLTDVIAGAVIGSAFGFGIPYLFHRPLNPDPSETTMISAIPIHGGAILSLSGTI